MKPHIVSQLSRQLRVFAALAGLLLASTPALAADEAYKQVSEPTLKAGDEIPAPTGEVVLKVSGNIGATQNGQKVIEFDMATLERLGVVTFTTTTNWTEGPVAFEGVLLSKLLEVVQASPDAKGLQLVALNDYRVDAPIEDSAKWPVIVATKENGQPMSVRDRGPLWIVYPQHAFPELDNREYLSRWVWQLAQIVVQ